MIPLSITLGVTITITITILITITDVRIGTRDTNGRQTGRLRQLLSSKRVGGTEGDESSTPIRVAVLPISGGLHVSVSVRIGIGGLLVVVWENEGRFQGEGAPGGVRGWSCL